MDEVENGNFGIVRANRKVLAFKCDMLHYNAISSQALANPRRVKEMCPLVLSEDNRTFFIIGGGKVSS